MTSTTLTRPYIAPRPRLRTRLEARLYPARLDRALARGEDPGSDPALALHAERLASARTRRRLAQGLRRAAASRSGFGPSLRATPRARAEIGYLGDRLLSSAAADVRGLARVRLLLTDGAGPLYWEGTPASPREELRAAMSALDGDD